MMGETIVTRTPIPFTTKSVYLALEPDENNHAVKFIKQGDVSYGAIIQRTPIHPNYSTRGADALQAVLDAYPNLAHDVCLRDVSMGVYIY
jgi:hypothetical protein